MLTKLDIARELMASEFRRIIPFDYRLSKEVDPEILTFSLGCVGENSLYALVEEFCNGIEAYLKIHKLEGGRLNYMGAHVDGNVVIRQIPEITQDGQRFKISARLKKVA